jgi:chlorite dismutase
MSQILPIVPLTLEGASVLHQMFRVRWDQWHAVDAATRTEMLHEARAWLAAAETAAGGSQSAAYAMLGHKGDLLLVHYRPDFSALLEAQLQVSGLRIAGYLEAVNSYLSVVELGLYESTRKIYEELAARGLQPDTAEWEQSQLELLDRQRAAMSGRLNPELPPSRYVCFYPIGRKYAGVVKQVISGSIGFDDWEWGVDLFADDPLPFKRLIYEMRFDAASAVYALFGPFYVGLRVRSQGLDAFMARDARGAIA